MDNITQVFLFFIKKFGVKQFDYIGDSIDDIVIWEKSNTVHTVNISNRVKKTLILTVKLFRLNL